MRVAIFGANGMLGWYMVKYLRICNHEIIPLTRKEYDIHSADMNALALLISRTTPDIVINCTNAYQGDSLEQFNVHSVFPMMLDQVCNNVPWIHVSTNGVFSGECDEEGYDETSTPDAGTMYGMTKLIGEKLINAMVIRVSVIGESDSNRTCLLEWLKSDRSKQIQGYTNHRWNGVTCLEFARFVSYLIDNDMIRAGSLLHVAPPYTYTKRDLIGMINSVYDLGIQINDTHTQRSNNIVLKSLRDINYDFPDLYEQLYDQMMFKRIESKPLGTFSLKHGCRFCDHDTHDIIHLGDRFGLAGGFHKTLEDAEHEHVYPLTLSLCPHCKYMQCKQVVHPDELFKKHYFYYSSMIPSLVEHYKNFVQWFDNRFGNKDLYIVEIGCNDGVLLKQLLHAGYHRLIGVDPSQTVECLSSSPVMVYNDYFDHKVANDVVRDSGKMDVFIACNSFAHIDNMQEVLANMKFVLKDDGVAIIEVHDSSQILQNKNFDFIYHEHMGYYTITSLYNICQRNGMSLVQVHRISNHGGSLRCEISMKRDAPSSEYVLMEMERECDMFVPLYLNTYCHSLTSWRTDLRALYMSYKKAGYTLYGYGASGRANTLINYCQLTFAGIIDDAESKIGSYTPMINIPIYSSKIIYEGNPSKTVVFILAWPYAPYIIETHTKFLSRGGAFVVPLPNISVTNKSI